MNKQLLNTDSIQSRIYAIRGIQVLLDVDLADIYQVQTKVFNQAVKRNSNRFPENFRFQLTENEWDHLRSQNVTIESQRGKHRKYLPFTFVADLISVFKHLDSKDYGLLNQ